MTSVPSGAIKKVFADDIEQCELPLAHFVPEVTANLFGSIAVVIYIFVLDWRLGLASLAPVVIGICAGAAAMAKSAPLYPEYYARMGAMNGTVVEYVRGIEIIKAFGHAKASYHRYREDIDGFRTFIKGWSAMTNKLLSIALTTTSFGLLVTLPLGALMLYHGSVELWTFLLVCCLSLAVAVPLIGLVVALESINTIIGPITGVFAWLSIADMQRPDSPAEQGAVNGAPQQRVTAANSETAGMGLSEGRRVSIRQKALDGVDLDAEQNAFTAIVGPSGSGKSTVARLMVAFWDPDACDVRLSGMDLKDIPLEQLMANVTLVAQDTFLYDATIAENLRVAKPESSDE